MTDTASPRAILRPDLWTAGALALAALLLMPVAAVAWMALFPTENVWPHLVRHALPIYLGNTIALMLMVGTGAAAIGTGAAWLVTMTEFPGRRWLEWALLAPLAMPAYIGAYALVDMLEYAGPVQTSLRAVFGWHDARDYWFPEIRSIGAAAFVLTMALYPYVYLLARAAFREQSVCALEVGRALGCGPWGVFWRVGLPLARPAVVAGTAIVCMETMADFGAVDYFAVPTLTRGIFSIWLETYNAGGAAQIAMVMLVFVMALLALERSARRGRIAIVLCDNLSIHTPRGSRLLRALLAEANAEQERLVLVYTPAYDPEANRIEWLWRALRRAVTHCHTRARLDPLLADADAWATALSPTVALTHIGSPCTPPATRRHASVPVTLSRAA